LSFKAPSAEPANCVVSVLCIYLPTSDIIITDAGLFWKF